jgi:dienelactone hydrolase
MRSWTAIGATAFEYLKNRSDIDGGRIGLLGVSQAGWIMPLAAVRAKDLAFLISVSGAGVPAAETTIDQAQNEMTGGHRDYTLRILPKANHLQLEAKVGTNAEMASLQRFVPVYFTTIRDWLAKRIRG